MLMILLHFFVWLALLIIALPILFLLLQVLAAIWPKKSTISAVTHSTIRPSIAVIMPAHNESLVISQSIKSILSQLGKQDQLLVVADNCSDDTATIAKNLSAQVIERTNLNARGKGYALDYGIQHLKLCPPQVLVIIDADCIVEKGAIDKLVVACAAKQRPIQALYLMEPPANPSLKARVAAFAWVVKNKVRPLGLNRLGMPCQLMGTGMAFLWQDIVEVNLASGHIVEDMKLGVDLTRANKPPLFLPDALVTSVFPPSDEATKTQRARWEHGHLSVIVSEVPSLLVEAFKTKNLAMLALAFDLLVPPLAVLVLLCFILFIVSFGLSSQAALFMAGLLLMALFAAVLLAWLFFGREVINFKQLCYAPIYALIKIPLYIKFFVNRQVDWVRSKRN